MRVRSRASAEKKRDGKIAGAVFCLASLGMFFLMARADRTMGGIYLGTIFALAAAAAAAWWLRPLAPWRDPSATGAGPYRAEDLPGGDPAPRIGLGGIGWPLVVGVAVCVPTMGIMGLWDPWETHYAEVAREILARDDWLSLWWQDEWFDSKPILLFWITAWSMAFLRVDFMPDGQPTAPEWAVRLPVVVLSILLLVVLARTARRYWGPRASILTAIALASMPYFAFLSRQAITDMPFVATMFVALAALLVALHTDEAEPAHRFRLPWPGGAREANVHHLIVAAFVLCAWPQIVYLLSRNVEILGDTPIALRWDVFAAGSGGNERLRPQEPAFGVQPALQALLWTATLAFGLLAMRRRASQRDTLLWTFYVLVALSALAKGIPGFAIPGAVALGFLVVTGRWSLLRSLRIGPGIVVAGTVLLPWFVALYVRHGPAFTDRLLVHDHVNRLLVGVHGDTGTLGYFLAQLGYGAFPWVALAPAAVLSWTPLRRQVLATPAGEARLFFSLVAVLAFGLYSAMVTKFHHYVFPMVPAMAVLVAVYADEVTATEVTMRSRARGAAWLVAAFACPALAAWGIVEIVGEDGRSALGVALVGLAAVGLVVAAWRSGVLAPPEPDSPGRPAVVVGILGAAVLAAFVGRDMAMEPAARPKGIELLVNLFIYNYQRQFPAGFERFYPWLLAFAVLATAILFAFAFPRVRRAALHAFCGFSLVFVAWVVYVYMWQLTPHWSQKDFVATYYRERASPDERLVAWQMNWKGENFYTGNRVVVYVSLNNDAFERWVERHRGERHFIATERPRLGSLRRTLGKTERTAPIADDSNNKYIMIQTRL